MPFSTWITVLYKQYIYEFKDQLLRRSAWLKQKTSRLFQCFAWEFASIGFLYNLIQFFLLLCVFCLCIYLTFAELCLCVHCFENIYNIYYILGDLCYCCCYIVSQFLLWRNWFDYILAKDRNMYGHRSIITSLVRFCDVLLLVTL